MIPSSKKSVADDGKDRRQLALLSSKIMQVVDERHLLVTNHSPDSRKDYALGWESLLPLV